MTRSLKIRALVAAGVGALLVAAVVAVATRGDANDGTPAAAGGAPSTTEPLVAAAESGAPAPGATASTVAPSKPGSPSRVAGTTTTAPASTAGGSDATPTTLPSTPAARAVPAAGTYTYDTTGFEELALGNNRHEYPARTSIVVSAEGCGVRSLWKPLPERWNESAYCEGESGGAVVKQHKSHREFSGQAKETTLDCAAATWAVPPKGGPATWSGTCSGKLDRLAIEGRVLADEAVQVDGTTVKARRVHLDLTLSGASRGTGTQDLWIDPVTAVVLRVISDLDVEVDTVVGPTRYVEHYELRLVR